MSKVLERASVNLFLGIDISKEKFDACCIGSNGDKRFRMSASMSREGFEEVLMKVSSITKDKETIIIGRNRPHVTISTSTRSLRPRDLRWLLSTLCSYRTS
jgi:hypothetical protein